MSPFFANFGYESKWVDDIELDSPVPQVFEKVARLRGGGRLGQTKTNTKASQVERDKQCR